MEVIVVGNGHSLLLRSSEEASDCQLRGQEAGVAFAICSSLPLSSVNLGRVNSLSLGAALHMCTGPGISWLLLWSWGSPRMEVRMQSICEMTSVWNELERAQIWLKLGVSLRTCELEHQMCLLVDTWKCSRLGGHSSRGPGLGDRQWTVRQA